MLPASQTTRGLSQDYKEQHIYWDSVIMARKLAMVMAVVFLGPIGMDVQVMALVLILIVCMALQVRRLFNRHPLIHLACC
jgi:hypothetical protein